MVKFKLGNTEIDYYNFAKHHRRMPVHIGRTYEDGSFKDLINDETFRQDVTNNPDATFTKVNQILVEHDLKPVTDLFVWLENSEYIERQIPYYSIGAMNTKQTTYLRLAFQFDEAVAYLDDSFDSSGTFAMSFANHISSSIVSDTIDEILERGLSIEECGIEKGDYGKNSYRMFVVSPDGWCDSIELELREIKEALVGVEIYDFKFEIVDNETDTKEGEPEYEISSR